MIDLEKILKIKYSGNEAVPQKSQGVVENVVTAVALYIITPLAWFLIFTTPIIVIYNVVDWACGYMV